MPRLVALRAAGDEFIAGLSAAWDAGVVVRALLTGTPYVVRDELEPGSGATLVSLVPAHLRRFDVSAFRTVLLGGQAPPAALPSNVVATYGMTETGGGVVYDGLPLDG